MEVVLSMVGLIYFLVSSSAKLTYTDQTVGSRVFSQVYGVILMGLPISLAISAVMHLWQPWPGTDSVNAEEAASQVIEQGREKHVFAPAVKALLVLVNFAMFR